MKTQITIKQYETIPVGILMPGDMFVCPCTGNVYVVERHSDKDSVFVYMHLEKDGFPVNMSYSHSTKVQAVLKSLDEEKSVRALQEIC